MTVKMCIKPFASPINKYMEPIGVCRSFNRQLQDKQLHLIKNIAIKKRKDMPKKPPTTIIRNVALGSTNTTQKLSDSLVKFREKRYGLRAANERVSSKKNNDFIYNEDKVATAPKVEVKNAGDNLLFVCHDEDHEEREGGITETVPKQSALRASNNQGEASELNAEPKKTSTDIKYESTNNFEANGRSEKASAGTMAFVQILLHTLSCSLSCQQPSCRKMGMVLKHYHSCQEKRRQEAVSRASMRNSGGDKDHASNTSSPKCVLCQQFAKIVAQHSMYLCNMSPQKTGCPVPMCDMMRKIRDSRKSSLEQVPMQT